MCIIAHAHTYQNSIHHFSEADCWSLIRSYRSQDFRRLLLEATHQEGCPRNFSENIQSPEENSEKFLGLFWWIWFRGFSWLFVVFRTVSACRPSYVKSTTFSIWCRILVSSWLLKQNCSACFPCTKNNWNLVCCGSSMGHCPSLFSNVHDAIQTCDGIFLQLIFEKLICTYEVKKNREWILAGNP